LFNYLFIAITGIYFVIILLLFIGLFFPNRERTSNRYRVSVVIAARNEEANIGTLLSELVQQTYPTELIEIIIANDGSEDRTGEIIDDFARKYSHIKHVTTTLDTETGLKAKKNALNQGIRRSTGEIILSTDADCHVQPTWVETMVSYFTEPVGMVVGFSQLGKPGIHDSLFEKLQALDFLSLMAAAQGSLNLGWPLAASGQNIGYRKVAFEAVGGFDKIKTRISGDDVLLLQLIRKYTPWQIRFVPDPAAFNWTEAEKTLASFLSQRKRWASNGSYQFKLNRGFFIFILWVFLINAIVIIGTPSYVLMSGTITVPLICLAAKLVIEFLITFKGAVVYQRLDLLKYFPLWSILQMPYILFAGIFGTLGHFVWKDRRYFQESTTFRVAS